MPAWGGAIWKCEIPTLLFLEAQSELGFAGMVEAALHAESQGGEAALTCFGQVPQGGAQRAPLQPLAPRVAVVQARPGQGPVPRVLLQAGALGHAGTNHPLLLLQLGCNTHGDFAVGVCWDKTMGNVPVSVGEQMPERSFTPLPRAGCGTGPLLEKWDKFSCLDTQGTTSKIHQFVPWLPY